MEYQRLRFALENSIARLTLTHHANANRVDLRLLRELEDAAEAIAQTPDVRALLLDADGSDFCAGWDAEAAATLLVDPQLDPFGPIAELAMPVVAALRGSVSAAGLELALTADIRIAAEDARLSMPDVAEGRLPLAGATQRLPRVAGRAAAMAMLLLGEELDASAALRCGLVSRVVPAAELQSQAEEIAQTIASRGPLGVRYAKEAAVRGLEMTLDQGLRFETDLSVILQTTADRAEGLRAFFEKRPPRFEGR